MRTTKTLFYIFITLCLQSCVGYNIVVDSHPKPNTYLVKTNQPANGWEKMPVYFGDERPEQQYELLLRIIVTGNQNAPEEKLLKHMKKEAARFGADAILLMDNRYVWRNTFDGVSTALNVISFVAFFDGWGDPLDLPMTGEYEACELEGIAIRFTPKTH